MQTTRNAKTAVQEWSERQGPRKRGPTSDKLAKETLPTLLMSKSPGLVGALVSGPRRVYLSLAIPPQQDKGGRSFKTRAPSQPAPGAVGRPRRTVSLSMRSPPGPLSGRQHWPRCWAILASSVFNMSTAHTGRVPHCPASLAAKRHAMCLGPGHRIYVIQFPEVLPQRWPAGP